MKLLFITDNGFSTEGGYFYYSNANIIHYQIVNEFFDKIVFIARNNSNVKTKNVVSNKHEVFLLKSFINTRNPVKNLNELIILINKEIKDADLVMCFGLNGYVASRIAKKYKKPVLAYLGGSGYDTLRSMDKIIPNLLAPFYDFLIKKMVKDSNYVHYVDKYLFERYPTDGEVLICASAKIKVSEENLKARLSKIKSTKDNDPTILGVIGYTHNKIKGIDTIVKALPILGEKYKLQVVGRGDHEWLDVLAEKVGVSDQIEFLGLIEDRENLFKWLDSIDIYLQPSTTEGMPRATLEAMSRACPVISTSVGGLKTLINEKFRINVGDFNELANKIKQLDNIENMLANAVNTFTIASKYNQTILNKKRSSFYKKIIHDLNFSD